MPTSRKAKTDLAKWLAELRHKMDKSQKELAAMLGVKPSTVSIWEGATRAKEAKGARGTKRNKGVEGYRPSAEILLAFADVAAVSGSAYDDDCIRLLKEAGLTGKAFDRICGQNAPQPSKPGDLVSLPLMEPAKPPSILVETASVELPAGLVRDPASAICIATSWDTGLPFVSSGGDTAFRPFVDPDHHPADRFALEGMETPGLVVIDKSKTDLAKLKDEELPVAVYYEGLQRTSFFAMPFAFTKLPGGRDILHGRSDVPYGSGVKEEFREATPDPANWDKPGIRLGWLTHQNVGSGRSCLLLCSAIVPALWAGAALQITKLHEGEPTGQANALPQWELLSEGLQVLGQVVLWMPKWTPSGELLEAKPERGGKEK